MKLLRFEGMLFGLFIGMENNLTFLDWWNCPMSYIPTA